MNNTTGRYIDFDTARLRNYYRIHSGIYDVTRWSFLFGRRALLDALPVLPSHPRILEVGCGTGQNMESLEHLFPDARIIGVDLSPEMLLKACAKFKKPGQTTLINCLYGSNKMFIEPFDLVLLSYTLTMTRDRVKPVLQQVYRDLKPGGYIAVVDFHSTSFRWFRKWMRTNHVELDENHLLLLNRYFQPSSVRIRNAYFGLWSYFSYLGRRS